MPVAGVELMFFQPWSHCWSKYWYFFFSPYAFLSKILHLLSSEELDGFASKDVKDFLMRLLQESRVEEACDLATVEWASRLLCRERWSILYRIDGGYGLVFTSALIVFLISFFQLLCSRPRYSIGALINGLRSSRKNQIRSNSFGAPSLSNS